MPTDAAFAARDQGGNDSQDSDVFAATGATATFTLAPGQVDASRDAGLEPAVIGTSANRGWDAGLRILPLFADRFESGDFLAWSSTNP